MGLTRTRFIQANTALAKIQDPITVLNSEASIANIDVGFLINRNGGIKSNAVVYWSESGSEFVTALTANSGIPDSNIVVSSYSNLRIGSLYGNIGGGNNQANVYITGSLIPDSNVAYDLGTFDNRFRSLFVSGNTIYIGPESLSINGSGIWSFTSNGTVINFGAGTAFNPDTIITGNLTVTSNLTIQGTQFIANTTDVAFVDSKIELHTLPNLAPLTSDDGRDIGFKFHYYKSKDEHAFLGWVNSSGYLEWFDSGREGVGNVFTGNTYGTIKSGGLILSNSTPSTSTSTGALTITGGAGIQGNLWVNNIGDVSANIGTIKVDLATLDANVASYQAFANANIGTFKNDFITLDANIGSYQLFANTEISNISANLGSYQIFANANASAQQNDIANLIANANANVAAYLLTSTGNISAGNLIATGNLYSQDVLVSGNVFGNISPVTIWSEFYLGTTSVALYRQSAPLTVDDLNITGYAAQANLAALANAATKTTVTSNVGSGTAYVTFVSSTTGNVDQNVNTALTYDPNSGNLRAYGLLTDTGVYWSSNGASYVGDINANIGAYQLYANANIGTIKTDLSVLDANVGVIKNYLNDLDANVGGIESYLYELDANVGAYQLYANANIGTIKNDLGNLDANIGAYQLYANANIGTIKNDLGTLDANVGSFESYANTKIGTNSNSNLVVLSTTPSTSNVTGALVVDGGAGISGNVYADRIYTSKGLFWAGNGFVISSGGGGTPGGNVNELQFNNNDSFDGANIIFDNTNGNLVITSTTLSSSTTTGALVVNGGIGVGGSLFILNTGDVSANIGTIKTDLGTLDANVGAYQTYANANVAAIQSNSGEFQLYANTKIGTNNNSNLVVVSTENSTSVTSGALVVQGGMGVAGNLTFGGNGIVSGKFRVEEDTNAVPYVMGTGAFHVAGGMSIGKDFWVGGNIYVANVISQTSTILQVSEPLVYLFPNSATYNYDIGAFSEIPVGGIPRYTGIVRSVLTGEWTFFSNINNKPTAGSVGVTAPEVIYDPLKVGNLLVANTTVSTNTDTGALIVKGGVGIAGALNIANAGDVSANIGSLQTQIANIVTNANANIAAYLPGYTGNLGGTITTASQPNITTLGGLTSFGASFGSVTAQGNLTVIGNFTVQGNTITIGSENLTVVDSIIDLHTPANLQPLVSDDGRDIGFRFHYYKGSDDHAFFGWENDTQTLIYLQRSDELNSNITGTYGNVQFGSLLLSNTTPSTSTTTGALVVAGGVGVAGNIELGTNLDFAGTGARITGDFSNATISNRLMFQTSVTDGVTNIYAIPNGTGTTAVFSVSTSSDPNNSSIGQLAQTATDLRIQNVLTGTGSYLPVTIYTGGSERVKIDQTAGNVVIVPTTPSTSATTGALVVRGGAGFAGNIFTSGWIIPSSNVSQNLGSTTAWWNIVYGRAVQAQYADLAENYTADQDYESGTVIIFGGEKEITTTTISHDTRVAGVISTNPGYLMNAANSGLPVAFTGRVPCQVRGPVSKGTVLVTSNTPGVAEAINFNMFKPGCVLGKSLEDIADNSIKTIEVVVGRF